MRRQYLVTVDHPQLVGVNEMKEHIKTSIGITGHMDPMDPLFELNQDDVTVQSVVPL